MWAVVAALFAGCKWLSWQRAPSAAFWRHCAYLFAWPGLNAARFLNASSASGPDPPTVREWAFASIKLALGVGLLYGAARLLPPEHPYLVGWIGMIGMVMILHFGVFHLLSCAWRSAGVEAPPLMNWPLASVSLGEFWGRRWNTAFRDIAHPFLFQPLRRRFDARIAVLAGFIFSGAAHELSNSLPPAAGWGGPTLYFVAQGLGLLLERSTAGRRIGLGRGLAGWGFTMLAVIGPAWLLFHPPLVLRVIVPFMKAIGAIP